MAAWLWAGLWPNIVAPPLWTLLGIAASHIRLARRQRIQGALLARHAAAGRRIAADTHLALTGQEHPDAPERGA